jgi:hypothetical protein
MLWLELMLALAFMLEVGLDAEALVHVLAAVKAVTDRNGQKCTAEVYCGSVLRFSTRP